MSSQPCVGQRQLVHGNLVALGQVGVEIIFAREAGALLHVAVERERGPQGEFERFLVQHRESAGQAEAHGAGVGIGSIAEVCGAGAEGLGHGLELRVDFQADYGFIFRHYFGRDFGRCFGGSAHGLSCEL